MAVITEWLNINVTAALQWSCFTILYQTSQAWKNIEGWKVCICLPPSHFGVLSVGVCRRLEQTQHVLLDETNVKEDILLFYHLNRLLFLWYNGTHMHSWPLYKHAVVVLNRHSETLTLLQSIDNDISHIHSIIMSVLHVFNTDKSPQLHNGGKEVKMSRVHMRGALQGPKTTPHQ